MLARGLLITLFITPVARAYTGIDICNYGKEVVTSVVCYRPTVLKETTVNGDVKVTGSLWADGILARAIVVEGDVKIQNSKVQDNVKVTGKFLANKVEFKKGVAVAGTHIVLNQSKVNGLMTITNKVGTPYLQLQCGSVITGSVLFTAHAGIVQVTADALIQGKVINGSLEFVKRNCDE